MIFNTLDFHVSTRYGEEEMTKKYFALTRRCPRSTVCERRCSTRG
jgi:hypothetical protein